MTLESFEKTQAQTAKPINKTVVILVVILLLSWGAMGYHYFVQMPKMASK